MPHMSMSRFGRGDFAGAPRRTSLILGNVGAAFGCACTSRGQGMIDGAAEGDCNDFDAMGSGRQAGGAVVAAIELCLGSRNALPTSHAPDTIAAAPAVA